MPKWKAQSMQLRMGLGAMRGNDDPTRRFGAQAAQQLQQYEQQADDRILCPYCGRKFNEQAG